MESKNLLLLAGTILFLAAAPKPAPRLPFVRDVLIEVPQLAGTPLTRVLSIAPVISLHEKMDYDVSVILPFSETSRCTVILYRRVAPLSADCKKQLCWEYVLSFADSAPSGSAQKRSLKQFSGDILIATWQRPLSSTPPPSSEDADFVASYLRKGSLHEFKLQSGAQVVIEPIQNH